VDVHAEVLRPHSEDEANRQLGGAGAMRTAMLSTKTNSHAVPGLDLSKVPPAANALAFSSLPKPQSRGTSGIHVFPCVFIHVCVCVCSPRAYTEHKSSASGENSLD
jgi:hypothetical protein